MTTLYYVCGGSVSSVGTGNNQAVRCSTGWSQVSEPVYSLISQQQAEALISAVLSIVAIYAIFKILYRIVR